MQPSFRRDASWQPRMRPAGIPVGDDNGDGDGRGADRSPPIVVGIGSMTFPPPSSLLEEGSSNPLHAGGHLQPSSSEKGVFQQRALFESLDPVIRDRAFVVAVVLNV